MHLLQTGVDITIIALWLGHEGYSPSWRRVVFQQGHGAAAEGGDAETWGELIKKVWKVDSF